MDILKRRHTNDSGYTKDAQLHPSSNSIQREKRLMLVRVTIIKKKKIPGTEKGGGKVDICALLVGK